MKRALATILMLLTVCFCFTGCMDNTQTNETSKETEVSTEAGPAETELTDGLPDIKYPNTEFRVVIQDGMSSDFETEDHYTDEPVHDAVRRKNIDIEERFGISLVVTAMEYTGITRQIKKCVDANDDAYDIALVQMVDGSSLALDNLVVPFEQLPYIDLSKPWWDKAIKNGFSINNNQMMANGDISPSSFNTTSCLFFNKKLLSDNDLDYPYQLVKEGKWTLDALYEYTRDMTKDKSGDSKITLDSTDQYGLVSWYLDVPYSFYYGAGGMIVAKDENDYPVLDLNVEKNLNIVTAISKVIIDNQALYVQDVNVFPEVAKTFAAGRALFYDGKLSSLYEIREMDDDFGILPIPKYNDAQTEYCSFVNGCANMLVIPASVKDLERTSIIVEAIAFESYKTVTPVLLETYLKRKSTRDAESVEMIDIIIRNRVFDMAYVNMYGGIGSYVRDLLVKKSTDVASTFKKLSKTSQKQIDKMIKAFNESREKN